MSAWSLRKEVSLGDLIAFASAAIAVIIAYTTLDKRLAIAETAVEEHKDVSIRTRTEIREDLKQINEKLDRLIERRAR